MLIQVGDSRSIVVDVQLAVSLAAVAGAINAAGFHAAGFFSANMTGNVSLLSDHLALGQGTLAALFGFIVLMFMLGAFAASCVIGIGQRRNVVGIHAYVILAEAALLGLLALADLFLPALHASPVLIVGLSFLMGVQNAATTLISSGRVRTTHVSGVATDLGIDLAALTGISGTVEDRRVVGNRFRLRAMTLLAFIAGGIAGVVSYLWVGGWMLMVLAGLLLVLSLRQIGRARATR